MTFLFYPFERAEENEEENWGQTKLVKNKKAKQESIAFLLWDKVRKWHQAHFLLSLIKSEHECLLTI